MMNHWLCAKYVQIRPWKMCGMSLGGVAMIPIKRYGRGGMSGYGNNKTHAALLVDLW